ncbi:MAG: 23S rRNA (pseudouridine(1915)-N(3))-methyltransferase RlmH, partial [Schleiferiaceae bacterium]
RTRATFVVTTIEEVGGIEFLAHVSRHESTTVQAPFLAATVRDRAAQRAYLKPGDLLVLLDERGQHLKSMEFADRLQKWMNSGPKRLVFAVGDAYGFDSEFRAMAQFELALSHMTFPHDLVRVLFSEQLYRAFSILRNEPYHHEG